MKLLVILKKFRAKKTLLRNAKKFACHPAVHLLDSTKRVRPQMMSIWINENVF
jgi:hypothetical protein